MSPIVRVHCFSIAQTLAQMLFWRLHVQQSPHRALGVILSLDVSVSTYRDHCVSTRRPTRLDLAIRPPRPSGCSPTQCCRLPQTVCTGLFPSSLPRCRCVVRPFRCSHRRHNAHYASSLFRIPPASTPWLPTCWPLHVGNTAIMHRSSS